MPSVNRSSSTFCEVWLVVTSATTHKPRKMHTFYSVCSPLRSFECRQSEFVDWEDEAESILVKHLYISITLINKDLMVYYDIGGWGF